MLLTIVVYIYTVIAFNFFRKFYVSEEEEEVDQKCHDMLTVSSNCCCCCQMYTNASLSMENDIINIVWERKYCHANEFSIGNIYC